jgi:hypothetical protein
MNVKHNTNYFKKSDAIQYVGIGLAIVGFAMLWFGWGWIAYILCTVGMPTGLALFFWGTAARSSESDIDECIQRETVGMEARFEGDRFYEKRILKHIPPVTAEGYEYREGLLLKKAKNGSLRSSVYTKAIIYVMSDRLYIAERCVYLVEDKTDKRVNELVYDDIERVELYREDKNIAFGKNSYRAKVCRISVKKADGSEWSAPINDDVESEKLVQTVNEIIDEYKKAREVDS